MLKVIATIGVIQVLAIFVNLIRTKAVAVFLGPEGVGIISTIDQVVQSAAHLSALSIPISAVKFLSKAHSEGHESFKRMYSSYLKTLLVLSAAGMAIAIVSVTMFQGLLDAELARYKTDLILALFGLPTAILGGFFVNVLAAAQRSTASATMAVITNLTLVISSCTGILTAGVTGLYIANALAGMLLTIGTLYYLREALDLPIFDRSARILAELKNNPNIILFCLMQYVATFAYSLSFLVARYTVLVNFGEKEAGLLQSGIALALALGMVMTPTNGLYLYPILNRNISDNAKIQAASDFQRRLIIILGLISVPIVLFSQIILMILYSSRFIVASQYIFLFVIWQCVLQLAGVYQVLLIGFDNLKSYAAITCAGYCTSIVLSWLLVPRYGIWGVAIGFLAASSIILVGSLMRLKSKYSFSIPGSLSSLIGYSLSVLLVAGLIFNGHEERTLRGIVIRTGVYLLFVSTLYFFLDKQERHSLYGLWHKIRFGAAQ